MKLQKTKDGKVVKVTFIPETEEEKLIMGALRNHYFFGMDKDGTYPVYDGITSEGKLVTSMKFKFNVFSE